jgi:hypothetical protein
MRPSLVAPASAGRSRTWTTLFVVFELRRHQTHTGAFVFVASTCTSTTGRTAHHGRVGTSATGSTTDAVAKQSARAQTATGRFRPGSDCASTSASTEQTRTKAAAT